MGMLESNRTHMSLRQRLMYKENVFIIYLEPGMCVRECIAYRIPSPMLHESSWRCAPVGCASWDSPAQRVSLTRRAAVTACSGAVCVRACMTEYRAHIYSRYLCLLLHVCICMCIYSSVGFGVVWFCGQFEMQMA